MKQTVEDVIILLEKAYFPSLAIQESNKQWLRKFSEDNFLITYSGDCTANTFDIARAWFDTLDSHLIQDGVEIKTKNKFDPRKQAILLVCRLGSKNIFNVFFYSTQQFD